jgi:hypothetical protein
MNHNYEGESRRASDPQLALLKQSVEHLTERIEEWQATAQTERTEMRTEIKLLQSEMTRYKGVLGGVTLMLSGCVTALMIAKGWLIGRP